MKKINLLFLVILPLIWFGFMYNVSAYNFNGYAVASKTDFYTYYNDNQVFHILCENGASCNYSSADMSVQGLTNVPFNQLRWLTRDVLDTNFMVGGTYRAVLFYQEEYLTSSGPQVLKHWTNNYTATAVCRSYNNTTSWTASVLDDCLLQFNKVESTTSGNYTTDVWSIVATFKPTTTDIGALSFRFNFNEVYALNTPAGYFSFTMERYSSINATALPDGSVIDYSDNFNEVINNQNQNTQDIIDNNNQNTQAIIDSNKSCTFYDKTSIFTDNKYLTSSADENSNNNFGISNYIKIDSTTNINVLLSVTKSIYMCFYNINKSLISCTTEANLTGSVTIPTNSSYFRFSIYKSVNRPQLNVCKNGSQAVTDAITDSDTSEANNDASNFFSGFQTDTYGLSSIITAPLNLIESLTSATCQELVLPLPFVNENLTLPCMTTIYQQNFGTFFTIYQTITFGIVSYWVIVRIFNLIKDFKNPDHDEIEVMDL